MIDRQIRRRGIDSTAGTGGGARSGAGPGGADPADADPTDAGTDRRVGHSGTFLESVIAREGETGCWNG